MILLLAACSGQVVDSPVAAPEPPQGPAHHGAPPMRQAFHATPTFELQGTVSETPHSIVVISLDTVRADVLALYGGEAKTEHLATHVAQPGTRFANAITHYPETCLSHWTMHSGVLPAAHGNAPANSGSIYTGPTLAEIAGQNGYATGAFIGGVTLQDASCGLGRGFDVYDDQFPINRSDMKRPADQVIAAAQSWIGQQDGPYFAFVHLFDAHFPYTPAAPWDTAYDPDYSGAINGSDAALRRYRDGELEPSARDVAHIRALYAGEVSELDASLAPLLESLGPDVLVLVTSDHGESFEHGYYFNHRAGLWEGVTRVPLLIRGPGVPSNQLRPDQVGLIDVTPTLLSLAGLPVDARMEGSALFDAEDQTETVVSVTDPWAPAPQMAVRHQVGTDMRKVIERPNDTLVYDLNVDPQELDGSGALPSWTTDAKRAYVESLKAAEAHQVTPPAGPMMTPEEAARLEALGYLTPEQKQQLPSNK
jgi:arylsulfatase A-like enzyme